MGADSSTKEGEKDIISHLQRVFEVATAERQFYTIPELMKLTGLGRNRIETILDILEVVGAQQAEQEFGIVYRRGEHAKGTQKGLVIWKK